MQKSQPQQQQTKPQVAPQQPAQQKVTQVSFKTKEGKEVSFLRKSKK